MRRRFFINRRVRFLRHFQRIFDVDFLKRLASPMMNWSGGRGEVEYCG